MAGRPSALCGGSLWAGPGRDRSAQAGVAPEGRKAGAAGERSRPGLRPWLEAHRDGGGCSREAKGHRYARHVPTPRQRPPKRPGMGGAGAPAAPAARWGSCSQAATPPSGSSLERGRKGQAAGWPGVEGLARSRVACLRNREPRTTCRLPRTHTRPQGGGGGRVPACPEQTQTALGKLRPGSRGPPAL